MSGQMDDDGRPIHGGEQAGAFSREIKACRGAVRTFGRALYRAVRSVR